MQNQNELTINLSDKRAEQMCVLSFSSASKICFSLFPQGSLYMSFLHYFIREGIKNAFDAKAKKVIIRTKVLNSSIITLSIADNGEGVNAATTGEKNKSSQYCGGLGKALEYSTIPCSNIVNRKMRLFRNKNGAILTLRLAV